MQNLIPIQITLQAANAADAKQLVMDLAGTLATMNPADVPARTEVSTVSAPVPAAAATYQQAPVTPGYSAVPIDPLTQPPVQTQLYTAPPAQQPGVVPTTAQTYTFDQLAVAATQLVDAGRRDDVLTLLKTFGVDALTNLPKEHYGAFATQLRALGAQI